MDNASGISYPRLLNDSIPVLLAVCVVSVPVIYAQDLPPMEITKKENRKMDSRLADLYDSVVAGNAPDTSYQTLTISNDGQDVQDVQVILLMAGMDAQVPPNLGIMVEATYEDMVQATVPIRNLADITANDAVKFVQMPTKPVPLLAQPTIVDDSSENNLPYLVAIPVIAGSIIVGVFIWKRRR